MAQIKFKAIGEGCRCTVRPVTSGYGDVKTVYGSRRRPLPRAGLIVESALPFDVGALVELDLVFSDQPFTYRSRGFVSWVFDGGDAAPRQLGVTITSMDKLDELGVSVSVRASNPVVESAVPPPVAPAPAPEEERLEAAETSREAAPTPEPPSPFEPVLGPETREAVQDVFDILSMLLPEDAADGSFEEVIVPSRDGVPDRYAEILSAPAARIDFDVHVPGHGRGRFCYLTASGADDGLSLSPLTAEEAEEMFAKLTGQRVSIEDASNALTPEDLAALSGLRTGDDALNAVIGMDEDLATVLCGSMRQMDSPAHFPTAPMRIDTTVVTHEQIGAPFEEPEGDAPPTAEVAVPMVRISQMPKPASEEGAPQRSVEERLMLAFQKIEGMYEILDQEMAAAFVLKLTRELIPCEAATCAFLVEGTAELVVSAASGTAARERLGERVPAPRGFLGFAIRSSQIASVTEPAKIYPQIDQISRMHVTSVLAAPITSGARVLGAVELLNAPSADGFSGEDGDVLAYLCQSLGEHVAQSIEPTGAF